MHSFQCKYIKNKYGNKAGMLLTDIDSLIYKTEAENIYENFYKYKELFDFCNFPGVLKYYNNANKLVVGKIKDKTFCAPMKVFVGLKYLYTQCIPWQEKTIMKKQKALIKLLLMMN